MRLAGAASSLRQVHTPPPLASGRGTSPVRLASRVSEAPAVQLNARYIDRELDKILLHPVRATSSVRPLD